MPARVPQDVDLEDRLVFNLTPLQFGYVVIGALGAAILWKLPWAPSPVRLISALPLVLCGAALAWGRWQGRGLDRWAADLLLFARHNVRLRWRPAAVRGLRWRRRAHRQARVPSRWRHRPPRPRPPRLEGHRP